jgi:hypothetical protein
MTRICSCDVSMKNVLTFVWDFLFFFWYCLALHSNVDLELELV